MAGTPPQGDNAKCEFACHSKVKARTTSSRSTESGRLMDPVRPPDVWGSRTAWLPPTDSKHRASKFVAVPCVVRWPRRWLQNSRSSLKSRAFLGGRRTGGESGIRTHGRVSPTHAFQACSFNHSDISPHLWNQQFTGQWLSPKHRIVSDLQMYCEHLRRFDRAWRPSFDVTQPSDSAPSSIERDGYPDAAPVAIFKWGD